MRLSRVIAPLLFAAATLAAPAAGAGEYTLRLPAGYGEANEGAVSTEPERSGEGRIVTESDVRDSSVPEGAYAAVRGVFVGVSHYANVEPDLPNASADARQMAETLQTVCGLTDPIILEDEEATADGMDRALRQIGAKDGRADLFIFYFAGHGVGLVEPGRSEPRGYILLHEALRDFLSGDRTGMIDMQLLAKHLEDAHIEAKHQLIILDCCYGGFGARPIMRGKGGGANAESFLNDPCVFVIAAGTRGQPALDGSLESMGHGLLTSMLLEGIESPERAKLELMPSGNRRFLSMADLQGYVARHMPERAQETIQAVALKAYRKAGITAPDLAVWRSPSKANLSPLERQTEQLARLYRYPQKPKAEILSGDGMVLLPIGEASKPEAEIAAAMTPAPAAPVVAGTSGEAMGAWADAVGVYWGDAEYGNALAQTLKLLTSGHPTMPVNAPPLLVSVEVLSRPRIADNTWAQIEAAEQIVPESSIEFEWREQWRRKHGAEWNIVHSSDRLSQYYELSFQIENHGGAPIHYWMVCVDVAGVLQWVGPENKACSDPHGPFSSGAAFLSDESRYAFPGSDPATGGSGAMPIGNDNDLYFFAVLSSTDWPELEASLQQTGMRACAYAKGERKSVPGASPPGVIDFEIGTRSPNAFRQQGAAVRSAEEITSSSTPTPLPYSTLAEGGFAVRSWAVEVLPGDQLRPALEVRHSTKK
ncbi:hypothetical protein BH09SUM1_BH09SUM1_09610 [soil metagenome]